MGARPHGSKTVGGEALEGPQEATRAAVRPAFRMQWDCTPKSRADRGDGRTGAGAGHEGRRRGPPAPTRLPLGHLLEAVVAVVHPEIGPARQHPGNAHALAKAIVVADGGKQLPAEGKGQKKPHHAEVR